MSTVKSNNVQVGQSATPTDNFTWYQPTSPDGTVRLGVGNSGSTTSDAVTINSSGNMTVAGTVTANGVTLGSYVPPSWTYFTASGTYTVPANVTSIRAYAGGAGGNGSTGNASGAGGGFAYGDIAVTAGQTVTVTISSGVATLAIGATTYLTGNPGGNASGGTGGTAGTATKHASVTNGGAYSGGAGISGTNPGGASCGSPLGNGYSGIAGAGNLGGGGGGIGGIGGYSGAGGAGGGAGGAGDGNIAGGSAAGRASRSFNARFTDPLLVNATSPGTNVSGGPGAGGGYSGGIGGDFGGGSGGGGGAGSAGGLMGGGGGGYTAGSGAGGAGGLGGGGGGGSAGGTGGGAFVFIYA